MGGLVNNITDSSFSSDSSFLHCWGPPLPCLLFLIPALPLPCSRSSPSIRCSFSNLNQCPSLPWSKVQGFMSACLLWDHGWALTIGSTQHKCVLNEWIHILGPFGSNKTLPTFWAHSKCCFFLETYSRTLQLEPRELYPIECCCHGILLGFSSQI